MSFANPTPYDYLPRRLHMEEIGNPYLIVHRFFTWENLPEWRNHLDKWLRAALMPGFQLNRYELVELFVRYEFIEILIEAVSLIKGLMNSFHLPGSKLYHCMDVDKEKLIPDELNTAIGYFNNNYHPNIFEEQAYYPVHLDNDEKAQPHQVIKRFFEYQNLPQYRDALYWWYVVAIDHTSAGESRGEEYIIKIHAMFQKLIEAVHLIHIRRPANNDNLF
ncbi:MULTISPECIES: hypothetical protein [Olivibacter]|uniref:Uncharacterized protein n=1 Tax=Olivibacter jilunii TaxID=985016 RepID=A0ABW6B0N6_9SPHI|nr:hypothetical protein [Olivibacter sp. UJ_SKK_5.1]MDX3912080.1 hypothetical protein [Pseudosphingobacterium sp.]